MEHRATVETAQRDHRPGKMASGGWGGIRTHETREGLPVFKTGVFNRSTTHPFPLRSTAGFGHRVRCARIGQNHNTTDCHDAPAIPSVKHLITKRNPPNCGKKATTID